MSKHEPYGNVKMKGKKTKLLPCGCCVARNGKKLCDRKKPYYGNETKTSTQEQDRQDYQENQ